MLEVEAEVQIQIQQLQEVEVLVEAVLVVKAQLAQLELQILAVGVVVLAILHQTLPQVPAATALSSCSGTSAPLATLGRTRIACSVQRDRTLTGLARAFPAALACGALPALPRVVHALAALL